MVTLLLPRIFNIPILFADFAAQFQLMSVSVSVSSLLTVVIYFCYFISYFNLI